MAGISLSTGGLSVSKLFSKLFTSLPHTLASLSLSVSDGSLSIQVQFHITNAIDPLKKV